MPDEQSARHTPPNRPARQRRGKRCHGLPAGFEMTPWYGMLAPAKLSQATAEKPSAAAAKAMHEPTVPERLSADAAVPVGGTAAEFAKFIALEQQRCKPVIVRATVEPD